MYILLFHLNRRCSYISWLRAAVYRPLCPNWTGEVVSFGNFCVAKATDYITTAATTTVCFV